MAGIWAFIRDDAAILAPQLSRGLGDWCPPVLAPCCTSRDLRRRLQRMHMFRSTLAGQIGALTNTTRYFGSSCRCEPCKCAYVMSGGRFWETKWSHAMCRCNQLARACADSGLIPRLDAQYVAETGKRWEYPTAIAGAFPNRHLGCASMTCRAPPCGGKATLEVPRWALESFTKADKIGTIQRVE